MAGSARAVAPCAAPTWEYRSLANASLDFQGAADANGNLYFMERKIVGSTETADLVSVSTHGVPRFRVPGVLASNSSAPAYITGPMVMGSLVILLRQTDFSGPVFEPLSHAELLAFKTSSGAPAWTTSLGGSSGPGFDRTFGRPAFGNGYVVVDRKSKTPSGTTSTLVGFDLATGFFAGEVAAPDGGPLIDTAGNLYAVGADSGTLAAFTPGGTLLYRVPVQSPPTNLSAVGEGVLVLGSGSAVRSAATGAFLFNAPTGLTSLISHGLVWTVTCTGFHLFGCEGALHLLGTRLRTGKLAWDVPIIKGAESGQRFWFSGPVATSISTVLVASQPDGGPATLFEVDSDGFETMACELPGTEGYEPNAMSIAGGEFVMSTESVLRGWDTGGLALAADGWPTVFGNLGASNRAR
jgi:outer membrane protein assembly factor BamB